MLRSALYIDFDNIFIHLLKTAGLMPMAHFFAQDPLKWLKILETTLPGGPRRFLIRKCYLNPNSFGRWRSSFVDAGFDVIDCPSLTSRGKTAADMHLAVDMLDKLHHATHYDEFVIFSADADFSPVLSKLREHDRRTAMVIASTAAESYQACADHVLSLVSICPAEVLEEMEAKRRPAPRTRAPRSAPAAARAAEAAEAADGSDAAVVTDQAAADTVPSAVDPTNEEIPIDYSPRNAAPARPAPSRPAPRPQQARPAPVPKEPATGSPKELAEEIKVAIRDTLLQAVLSRPNISFTLSRTANLLTEKFGPAASRWFGYRRASKLFEAVDLSPVGLTFNDEGWGNLHLTSQPQSQSAGGPETETESGEARADNASATETPAIPTEPVAEVKAKLEPTEAVEAPATKAPAKRAAKTTAANANAKAPAKAVAAKKVATKAPATKVAAKAATKAPAKAAAKTATKVASKVATKAAAATTPVAKKAAPAPAPTPAVTAVSKPAKKGIRYAK